MVENLHDNDIKEGFAITVMQYNPNKGMEEYKKNVDDIYLTNVSVKESMIERKDQKTQRNIFHHYMCGYNKTEYRGRKIGKSNQTERDKRAKELGFANLLGIYDLSSIKIEEGGTYGGKTLIFPFKEGVEDEKEGELHAIFESILNEIFGTFKDKWCGPTIFVELEGFSYSDTVSFNKKDGSMEVNISTSGSQRPFEYLVEKFRKLDYRKSKRDKDIPKWLEKEKKNLVFLKEGTDILEAEPEKENKNLNFKKTDKTKILKKKETKRFCLLGDKTRYEKYKTYKMSDLIDQTFQFKGNDFKIKPDSISLRYYKYMPFEMVMKMKGKEEEIEVSFESIDMENMTVKKLYS